MKRKIKNKQFEISPKRENILKIVFPINLKIGDIFTGGNFEQKMRSGGEGQRIHNFLMKVKKIELLNDFPNHLIIQSSLVGALNSNIIYESFQRATLWKNEKKLGKQKFAITEYYDEKMAIKCHYYEGMKNSVDIFFISTDNATRYFLVNVSKLQKIIVNKENTYYLGYL